MIDFWIFPLSTIWGAYHFKGFQASKEQGMRESNPVGNPHNPRKISISSIEF